MSTDDLSQASNEAEDLKIIDNALAEFDPQFLNELSSIRIDQSAIVDFSVIDQALSNQSLTLKEKFLLTVDFKTNPLRVSLFWFFIFTFISATFYIFKSHFWSRRNSLFMTSFAQLNSDVQLYNPLTESQFFFDNPRIPKNMFLIKKMLVNLKPSSLSGSNPMLAFEMNAEGLSKEVVIELKDRESEFIDRILPIVEEYTYDELSDNTGKAKLSEQVLELFNSNLTQGQIRKVMYGTFILKN